MAYLESSETTGANIEVSLTGMRARLPKVEEGDILVDGEHNNVGARLAITNIGGIGLSIDGVPLPLETLGNNLAVVWGAAEWNIRSKIALKDETIGAYKIVYIPNLDKPGGIRGIINLYDIFAAATEINYVLPNELLEEIVGEAYRLSYRLGHGDGEVSSSFRRMLAMSKLGKPDGEGNLELFALVERYLVYQTVRSEKMASFIAWSRDNNLPQLQAALREGYSQFVEAELAFLSDTGPEMIKRNLKTRQIHSLMQNLPELYQLLAGSEGLLLSLANQILPEFQDPSYSGRMVGSTSLADHVKHLASAPKAGMRYEQLQSQVESLLLRALRELDR